MDKLLDNFYIFCGTLYQVSFIRLMIQSKSLSSSLSAGKNHQRILNGKILLLLHATNFLQSIREISVQVWLLVFSSGLLSSFNISNSGKGVFWEILRLVFENLANAKGLVGSKISEQEGIVSLQDHELIEENLTEDLWRSHDFRRWERSILFLYLNLVNYCIMSRGSFVQYAFETVWYNSLNLCNLVYFNFNFELFSNNWKLCSIPAS